MQHAGPAAGQGGGVGAAVEAVAGRLDANDLDAFIVQEGWNKPIALEPPPMQAIKVSNRPGPSNSSKPA